MVCQVALGYIGTTLITVFGLRYYYGRVYLTKMYDIGAQPATSIANTPDNFVPNAIDLWRQQWEKNKRKQE
jgi:hypothetical protein